MPSSAQRHATQRGSPRGRILIIGLVLLAVLALVNLATRSGASGGEPLKGAAELAALPDDQLEGALLGELGRAVYREGAAPDAWRGLATPARHLWAVAAIRRIDPQIGLEVWLKESEAGATTPGPEEMRDGLEAMELTAPRQVMEEIIARRRDGAAVLDRLHTGLRAALDEPATRTARQAWVRAHLAELAGR